MGTVKVNNLIERTSTNDAEFMFANSWCEFDMVLNSLTNDRGVSSLTDEGTGQPLFTADNARPRHAGACWTLHGLYSNNYEYPNQKGGLIVSTTTWRSFCGSNTTARNDWKIGYSGVTAKA